MRFGKFGALMPRKWFPSRGIFASPPARTARSVVSTNQRNPLTKGVFRMTLAHDDLKTLVSTEKGEIDRRIFTDQDIFDQEMREIFGRAWLFLCHESQIPKAGDFVEAPMGRDNVLVVRQKDKTIRALLNTCSHRGNAVCRAEEGNTKNFMCTYHGWTFDLGGKLVGVPGLDTFYGDNLDKSKLGLRQVAQLDSYKGFVFGTFDPDAPPLYDFLGATGRLGMDLIAERGEDMEIVPGIQKFVIDCNWKFTVDNLFDWYHPIISHMSAAQSGFLPELPEESFLSFLASGSADGKTIDSGGSANPDGGEFDFSFKLEYENPSSIVALGEYGHAIAGPPVIKRAEMLHQWRKRPGVAEALGPVGIRMAGHPNIFPTLWVTTFSQICLRVPRTPTSTEIWWYTFTPKNATEEERNFTLLFANHIFGPAGLLEQEDGENWVQSTVQAGGDQSSQVPQALKMNLGKEKIIHEHGLARIEGNVNEHAQLWTYRAWVEWMSGQGWDSLRENTIPGDSI
ncbi:aromatic ring-hydroxylating dioxygenase subunit alpha [Rhodococcus pyridinivorans]|uniref:aromatic ring-hydroxylating oxygenase subunit alpha n=1 Tax=Rhodococcus pyridinivorans TaxID=103816 RepID=UPI001E337D96|nr:aromatic ring-hydroxylating dioxygenase subunit alpha [Rhodococcus pyridinivorans]MCD5422698.1 aromatic ring-hydroxylating dioxygenase subunit alpha [Rhodococcus pyridinivorans]